MIAEIVSVGTELLLGQIADTNAQYLGQVLPGLGISHLHRQTVGDNLNRLASALQLALSRSDIVFTIGGLGPTEDDLTREGIASVLGVRMDFVPEYAEGLKEMFALRNIPWVESQNRQAMVPIGATMIANANGTAPGLICEAENGAIIALPGPRGEFVPMIDGPVREYLVSRFSGQVIHSRLLRVCAMGESQVEDILRDLIGVANPSVAPYAKLGEVHLRITAAADSLEVANRLLEPVVADIRSRLGWRVFGQDDTTLEAACLTLMADRGLSLGTAESITGGALGARLTEIPGSSRVFRGGIVAYSASLKSTLLGVPEITLSRFGPVSKECATAMAEGGHRTLGVSVCLSLTGNAGPEADTGNQPVGLVFIAMTTPDGTTVEEYRFRGRREDVRERASQFALTLLYKWLMGVKA